MKLSTIIISVILSLSIVSCATTKKGCPGKITKQDDIQTKDPSNAELFEVCAE